MLSVITNPMSILANDNLNKSTTGLNKAIEKLSTGFKINKASDNAADYSISKYLSGNISGYDVAHENLAMGIDMLSTAQGALTLMSNNASRLWALCVQARNGTYGQQSLEAMQLEAEAIKSSIDRTYNTAEYNGIKFFDRAKDTYVANANLPMVGDNGFINSAAGRDLTPNSQGFIDNPVTYTDAQVAAMQSVSEVSGNYSSGVSYKISCDEELAKLAADVNSGKSTSGAVFVLANDIDLSSYCAAHVGEGGWTAIGISGKEFKGTFNGNGHKIKNMTLNCDNECQGLFGSIRNGAGVKNVGLENCYVKSAGRYCGGLVGLSSYSGNINNCYVTGKVEGSGERMGMLVGYCLNSSSINDCYAKGSVSSESRFAGGLVGYLYSDSIINNCFADVNVLSSCGYIGGLLGRGSNC